LRHGAAHHVDKEEPEVSHLPKFNADASLYRTSEQYRVAGPGVGPAHQAEIIPQQIAGCCTACALGFRACCNLNFRVGWPPVSVNCGIQRC